MQNSAYTFLDFWSKNLNFFDFFFSVVVDLVVHAFLAKTSKILRKDLFQKHKKVYKEFCTNIKIAENSQKLHFSTPTQFAYGDFDLCALGMFSYIKACTRTAILSCWRIIRHISSVLRVRRTVLASKTKPFEHSNPAYVIVTPVEHHSSVRIYRCQNVTKLMG